MASPPMDSPQRADLSDVTDALSPEQVSPGSSVDRSCDDLSHLQERTPPGYTRDPQNGLLNPPAAASHNDKPAETTYSSADVIDDLLALHSAPSLFQPGNDDETAVTFHSVLGHVAPSACSSQAITPDKEDQEIILSGLAASTPESVVEDI